MYGIQPLTTHNRLSALEWLFSFIVSPLCRFNFIAIFLLSCLIGDLLL